MGALKELGIGAGSLGTVLGAGYADNEWVKHISKKEREEKENSKEEELKRKQEPSGGDNRSTGTPKVMKKGGSVKSASARADGCAIRCKTRA